MKKIALVLAIACVCSPAFAARGRCRGGSCKVSSSSVTKVYGEPSTTVYSMPTTGKSSYTVDHPAVVRPSCKDGKCRLAK